MWTCVAKPDRSSRNPKRIDRKSTRLNSSHSQISYAVFCLKKKTRKNTRDVIIRFRNFRALNVSLFFFFNDTATTEIYTLPLPDALPISADGRSLWVVASSPTGVPTLLNVDLRGKARPVLKESEKDRSEEHTSELQSQSNLVCRLLLEKKNKKKY